MTWAFSRNERPFIRCGGIAGNLDDNHRAPAQFEQGSFRLADRKGLELSKLLHIKDLRRQIERRIVRKMVAFKGHRSKFIYQLTFRVVLICHFVWSGTVGK